MGIKIRNERAGDVASIHRVIELAFRDAPHTAHTEQFIVDALRRAEALTISKVAESDGEIGHVAIFPVVISAELFNTCRSNHARLCSRMSCQPGSPSNQWL